jgi:hypothetical protein
LKKGTDNLVDCNSKKADQNGVQDERTSSPFSERSMDKEAQEMVAALEMRIKEEPEDEEEEEDRTEGEEDLCDGSLRMNGESHKFKSGESFLWVGCTFHYIMPSSTDAYNKKWNSTVCCLRLRKF